MQTERQIDRLIVIGIDRDTWETVIPELQEQYYQTYIASQKYRVMYMQVIILIDVYVDREIYVLLDVQTDSQTDRKADFL